MRRLFLDGGLPVLHQRLAPAVVALLPATDAAPAPTAAVSPRP
jgi:hypothetical protein